MTVKVTDWTITVPLPAELVEQTEDLARGLGASPEHVIAAIICRHCGGPPGDLGKLHLPLPYLRPRTNRKNYPRLTTE